MTRAAMLSRWRPKACSPCASSTRWITSKARYSSSNSPSSSSSGFARDWPSSCVNRPDRAFLRLVFAGTPDFAEQALVGLAAAGHEVPLVLTRPDRPAGRGQHVAQSAVKRFALKADLPVYQPQSLGAAEVLDRVREARADAVIVAAYGALLPPALLEVARLGAFNIHASLLPRWRGAAPIQRALLAGDRQTGVSIMRMDAGLDTGPVLAQKAIEIGPDDDAGTLHDRLASLGAQM